MKLTKVVDGIEKKLDSMVNRAKSIKSYFAKVAYPRYQKAQIQRWQTENESEGERWTPLNPFYKSIKPFRFAGYDYGGTKMLIATGELLKSVVGKGNSMHQAIFTNTEMVISTSVPYAGYVAYVRPFMEFSQKTIDAWEQDLQDFIDEALG